VAAKVKHVAKKVAVVVKKVKPFVAAAALLVPGVGVAIVKAKVIVKAKAAAVAAKIKGGKFAKKVIKTVKTIKSKVDKVKKVVKKVQNVRKTIARARDCLRQNGCVKAAVKSAAKSFVRSKVAAIGGAVVRTIKSSNVGKAVAGRVDSVRSSVLSSKAAVVSRINDGASKLRSAVPQKLQGTFDRADRSVRAGAASAASKLRDRAVSKIGDIKPVARATKALKSIRDKVSTFSSTTEPSKHMVVTSGAHPAAQPVISSSSNSYGERPNVPRPRSSSAAVASVFSTHSAATVSTVPNLSSSSSSSSRTDRPNLSRPRSSTRPVPRRASLRATPRSRPVRVRVTKSCGKDEVKWGSKCIPCEHGGTLSSSSSRTDRPNLSRPRRNSSSRTDSPKLSRPLSSSSSSTDRPKLSRPRSSTRPVPRRSSLRATPRSRPVRVRVSKPKSGIFLKIVVNALEQAGYDADDLENFEYENVFDDLD